MMADLLIAKWIHNIVFIIDEPNVVHNESVTSSHPTTKNPAAILARLMRLFPCLVLAD